MEQKQYEVDVVYHATVRYVVKAPDREAAERLATQKWLAEEEGVDGSEWCELETVSVMDAPDEEGCGRDCDEALRFLRDRELVIERLDEDAFNPTVHDAVSAEDVAHRLGWVDASGQSDTGRAARALERLCAARRVVCFSRPRVRKGERGEIRLFCTPQHLERLSALLDDPEVDAQTERDRASVAQPA